PASSRTRQRGVADERCCPHRPPLGPTAGQIRRELEQGGRPVPAQPGRVDKIIHFVEEHGDGALGGSGMGWPAHRPAGGLALIIPASTSTGPCRNESQSITPAANSFTT